MKKIFLVITSLAVLLAFQWFDVNNSDKAEAATYINGIYNSSADFSSTQGYKGWYYLTASGANLTWDPANNWWAGPESFQLIYQDGEHPGGVTGVTRRWKPSAATAVRIMGNAHDTNNSCGDGVSITIKKKTQTIYQKAIANGDSVGTYFDLDATATATDYFDFIVTKGTADNWCDATYFDIYIVPVTNKTLCNNCMQFKVGPAVKVLGPVSIPADSPFVAFNSGGQITGYTANGQSFKMQGPDMDNLTLDANSILGAGTGTNFDNCGAWLQSLAFADNIIKGWYHAEKDCNYQIGQTHKSVGYVESYDGGQTFVKPNYPNNVVLQGSVPQQPNMNTGAGDQTVVRWKNNLYMYFMDLGDWHTGVARATVSSGGLPGTWWKWYNGGFTAPGLSSDVTTIGFFGVSASHNALFDALTLIGTDKWFGGLKLSNSKNATTFTSVSEPLLITDDEDWARDPADKELIVYPSIITPAGNSWVNGFYLFYTYLQPGEDFTQRYLVYRKVEVSALPTAAQTQVRVELNNYFSNSLVDNWTTNTMVPNDFGFTQKLGYTFTQAQGTETTPIYDCNIPSWNDHMVGVGGCSGSGEVFLRTLGWIWNVPKPNSLPLYRCIDWTNTDHFVSTNSTCDNNGQMEFILGYIEQ